MIDGHVRIKGGLSHLIADVKKTTNAFDRARGLLFRKKLQPDQGLWIEPCPSVHTMGMLYAIDVVFLNREGVVLDVRHQLAPLRLAICQGASITLELLAGMARQLEIEPGMQLVWNQKRK